MTITDRLPSWFEKTSFGQSILKERDQQKQADTLALIQERDRLDRELLDLNAAAEKKEQPLRVAVRAAQVALIKAQERLAAAHTERARTSGQIQHHIERLNCQIVVAADPRIDAALHELFPRWHRERQAMARTKQIPTGQYDAALQPIVQVLSNEPEIKALLDLMRRAQGQLEALKLVALDDVASAISTILEPVETQWHVVMAFGEAVAA